ncbi:pyridoxal phosphate-dependent aminotransferase [Desulfovibrio sp. OttesenSCG-928-A18]|nr:pyridoxal phosphate-dependent aminotransferase [Desulfovibrio sp. OttesenSCG-928-A18]
MGASVCRSLASFLVMDILEKAQELEQAGARVIHLEIGQPDFETPACVNEAAERAIRDKRTGYTHSMGILPLREAVAGYYARVYGLEVSPEQVMITNGTSPGMLLLFSVLCEPGDAVIMADPSYACYESFVRYAGAEAIRVPASEEAGFQLDPAAVKRALSPKTRAILINSPSNPAGAVMPEADMRELARLGPMLVSDEIYHGLVYEGTAVSALQAAGGVENCAVLDGFSKRYAMTGWRLGWLVAPRELMPTLQVLQQNFFISPNSISQWAGIAALNCADDDVRRMAAEYDRRRLYLVDALRRLGFGVRSSPVGAFYVLADARELFKDQCSPDRPLSSLALAFDILDKAHVGLAPGIDFGPGAEGYLRFSYANSLENIEEAIQRLACYLEQRAG